MSPGPWHPHLQQEEVGAQARGLIHTLTQVSQGRPDLGEGGGALQWCRGGRRALVWAWRQG